MVEFAQLFTEHMDEKNVKYTVKSENVVNVTYNGDNKDEISIYVVFDKDGKCNFVDSAKKLNASLRTGALAFEAGYLGFGLPALNKMRLKKEYLDKAPTQTASTPTYTSIPYSGSALIKNKISYQEAQLYKNFLK